MKMVFVASIIRNKLCITYAFFDYIFLENHFLAKIIFGDKFDSSGSIVYLSCLNQIIGLYLGQLGDELSMKTHQIQSHFHFHHLVVPCHLSYSDLEKSPFFINKLHLNSSKFQDVKYNVNRYIMSQILNWWCQHCDKRW